MFLQTVQNILVVGRYSWDQAMWLEGILVIRVCSCGSCDHGWCFGVGVSKTGGWWGFLGPTRMAGGYSYDQGLWLWIPVIKVGVLGLV